MMPNSPTTAPSLRIPAPVLLRWMTKAALLGLFVGTVAGIAALRAG